VLRASRRVGARAISRDKRHTDKGHSATDLVHDPPFINGHSVREAEARVHDDAAALVVCARCSLSPGMHVQAAHRQSLTLVLTAAPLGCLGALYLKPQPSTLKPSAR
jgi:hypothetical protein